jgi:predicted dehydrogenase
MAFMASRIPAGHHEGFIEAFANIYRGFVSAIRGDKGVDFPTAEEGVRTMRFVEAVLKSSAAGGRWTGL